MAGEISARLNDVILYEQDARLLEPGRWLSDQCIAFAFEYLAGGAPAAQLLEPATTFMASVLGDAAALREVLAQPRTAGAPSLADQLSAPQTKLVFLPINDKDDPDAHDGGGHWSLLVYRRRDGEPDRFEHYDSCECGANAEHARAAARVFEPLLRAAGAPPPKAVKLVKMTTPQQANGYDCGVYALCIAELLCDALSAEALEAAAAAVRSLTPAAVTAKRAEWLERVRAGGKKPRA